MTRQQVNLYLPEFRRRMDWLAVEKMASLAGVFILLLAALSGWEYWQLYRVEQELAERSQALTEVVDRTNQLVDNLGVQSEDEDLSARVQRLEETLNSKRTLLEFLQGRELGNAIGFSEYLADLGRYHITGLSLARVELRQGGNIVRLGGQVNRAEYVPLFLQNLSNSRSYSGKSFETLRIEEVENGEQEVLEFQVATRNGQ